MIPQLNPTIAHIRKEPSAISSCLVASLAPYGHAREPRHRSAVAALGRERRVEKNRYKCVQLS